ncbi:VanZ family protein [Loigolactobacillus coryniformis]|uniref:VanZ family protein n=1 Tax=Loigolactobacillus coryniformis TaxID=1610 RepID=UPI00201A3A84|nr:VanZ family protein [Loigolactobacillus coryniformis]MCL5459502.1 VanZ family protein [Loigolactobacillus coryniformis]
MTKKLNSKQLTQVLFVIYLLALVWIIIFKLNLSLIPIGSQRSINLIPFAATALINGHIDWAEPLLNVLVFVPLGLYVANLFKPLSVKIRLIVAVSVLCEVTQYVFGIGATDITDVITNTVGGMIGILSYQSVKMGVQNSDKIQKVVNQIAVVATVICMGLLVVVKIGRHFLA